MNNQNNQNFDPIKILNTLRDSANKIMEEGIGVVSNIAGAPILPVDILETETAVIIKAGPLLGIKPEAIDVSITANSLTIKGETQPDAPGDGQNVLRRERKFGPFSRTVTIPRPVKADQGAAEFKDGILTITLPKIEEPQPKIINVKTTDTNT